MGDPDQNLRVGESNEVEQLITENIRLKLIILERGICLELLQRNLAILQTEYRAMQEDVLILQRKTEMLHQHNNEEDLVLRAVKNRRQNRKNENQCGKKSGRMNYDGAPGTGNNNKEANVKEENEKKKKKK